MEKLFYAIWRPDDARAETWCATLRDLPGELAVAGAQRIRIGVPDVPLPADDPYADMRRTAPHGFVSFWLNSAYHRHSAEALVQATTPRLAGYAVQESTILPNTAPAAGNREDGFLQVCGFAALPGLSRTAFWAAWLEQHTDVAVQTQATIFYNQNIVTRPLTDGAPTWDAIVEERFPDAALNDRAAYFAAAGDPARMAANSERMARKLAPDSSISPRFP